MKEEVRGRMKGVAKGEVRGGEVNGVREGN